MRGDDGEGKEPGGRAGGKAGGKSNGEGKKLRGEAGEQSGGVGYRERDGRECVLVIYTTFDIHLAESNIADIDTPR